MHTWTLHFCNIPFLDVNILLQNNKLETDFFCKPTNKHQYFLQSSSHPYHTKQSIPYSLALRLRRICSKDTFFLTRSKWVNNIIVRRSHKKIIVREQIIRAQLITRKKSQEEHISASETPEIIPFIITHNLALPNIQSVLRKNNLFSILQNV